MPPCHAPAGGRANGGGYRPLFRLRFPGRPEAVRHALARVMTRLAAVGIAQDERTTAELVLAEALNNIVEHAYAASPGPIGLDVDHDAAGLLVTLHDVGAAMPRGGLPKGHLPDHGTTTGALPEGGFGWFLIHTLAQDLRYDRMEAGNRLRFRLQGAEGASG